MKKLLLFILLLMPFTVFAADYKLEDMVISLENPEWIIFTKETLENNPAIVEHKLDYNSLKDLFVNKSVYLDASIYNNINPAENLELVVGIVDANSNYNLHNYSKRQLKKIEEETVKDYSNYEIKDHSIYSNDKYTFVSIYYEDNFVYIIDYNTIINGKTYTIKFQRGTEFNDTDKENFEKIIDTIEFDRKAMYEKKPPLLTPIERIITYAVVGGLIGGIVSLIFKRK